MRKYVWLFVPLFFSCQPKKTSITKPGGGSGNNPAVAANPSNPSNPSNPGQACLKGEITPDPKEESPAAGSMVKTVGAGRVRLRHEKEERFARFGSFYWEKRSFALEVEDYSLTSEKKLVITFKPIGPHALDQDIGLDGLPNGGLPNVRIFETGEGNVFHINEQMKEQVSPNVFRYTFKDPGNNDNLKLEAGRVIAFEFGVFFDKKQMNSRTDGDTNYYTDTFRIRLGKPGLIAGIPGKVGGTQDPLSLAGGKHSVPMIFTEKEAYLSISQNALNLKQENLQLFLEGRSLFHSNFTTGNHSEEGLHFRDDQVNRQKNLAGPNMDTTDCAECHQHNGRPEKDGKTAPQLVLKMALDADFGLQLQQNERDSLGAKLIKDTQSKEEKFADGTSVTLKKDVYRIDGKQALISPRVPPQVYGLGLLEAISESNILARQVCDSNALPSGRAVYAINPETGKMELGRFGWKAQKVSLRHQVGEAANFDLGVTNPVLPTENCERTGACGASAQTEIDADMLKRITSYTQMIAVPVQRNRDNAQFAKGEKVFAAAGCPACHVPKQVTGNEHPIEELRNQVIYPFSDLLLHDMGEGLQDTKPDGDASAAEWRTPPLWGLGLLELVNGQYSLLHDGRAKSFEEAVLWHGGEAAAAQLQFKQLPKQDREDLVFFLKSI